MQPLTTFDEVCSLACKLERQHKGSSFGEFKYFKNETELPSSSKEVMDAKPTTQEVMDALKGKLSVGNSKEPSVKKTVCFFFFWCYQDLLSWFKNHSRFVLLIKNSKDSLQIDISKVVWKGNKPIQYRELRKCRKIFRERMEYIAG